jgi:hypothetical protein
MAEADCPGTTIAVDRGVWTNLSPEYAALVAPPVTVSSAPVAVPPPQVSTEPDVAALEAVERGSDLLRQAQQARSRANMPVERHRRPTR